MLAPMIMFNGRFLIPFLSVLIQAFKDFSLRGVSFFLLFLAFLRSTKELGFGAYPQLWSSSFLGGLGMLLFLVETDLDALLQCL